MVRGRFAGAFSFCVGQRHMPELGHPSEVPLLYMCSHRRTVQQARGMQQRALAGCGFNVSLYGL